MLGTKLGEVLGVTCRGLDFLTMDTVLGADGNMHEYAVIQESCTLAVALNPIADWLEVEIDKLDRGA